MYFLDDLHLDEFLKLVSAHRKERFREYVAAYYLLTSDTEIRFKLIDSMLPQGNIDWSQILAKKLTDEKKLIVLLAFYLFSESNLNLPKEYDNNSNEKIRLLIAQAIEVRKNWPRCCYIA